MNSRRDILKALGLTLIAPLAVAKGAEGLQASAAEGLRWSALCDDIVAHCYPQPAGAAIVPLQPWSKRVRFVRRLETAWDDRYGLALRVVAGGRPEANWKTAMAVEPRPELLDEPVVTRHLMYALLEAVPVELRPLFKGSRIA